MKYFYGFFMLLLISSSSFALDLNFLVRPELVKQSSDDKSPANEINKEDERLFFRMKIMRLIAQHKLNEETSLYGYFDFLNSFYPTSTAAKDGVDQTGSGVYKAFIEHKLAEKLILRAGKQGIEWGGWENSYDDLDHYSYSAIWYEMSSYRTGLGMIYEACGQTFTAQILNNGFSEYNQSSPMYGLAWRGNFLDGLIEPLVSYYIDPRTEQKSGGTAPGWCTAAGCGVAAGTLLLQDLKAGNDSYLGAGVRGKTGKWIFDFDYLMKVNSKILDSQKDDVDKSFALLVKYDAGNFKPQIKYTMNEYQGFSNNAHNYTGEKTMDLTRYHIALEYYPSVEKPFRYHLAYQADDYKPTSAANVSSGSGNGVEVRGYSIILGVAASF